MEAIAIPNKMYPPIPVNPLAAVNGRREIDIILAVEPLPHLLIHVQPQAVRGPLLGPLDRGQELVDVVPQHALRGAQVPVPLGAAPQHVLGERGRRLAVDGHDLVLVVDELDISYLPLRAASAVAARRRLLEAEEVEPAVAVDVEYDGGHAARRVPGDGEPLRDGRLHLAHGAPRLRVQVHERPALAVHDEVAARFALLGDLDEAVDGLAFAPGWEGGMLVAWLS